MAKTDASDYMMKWLDKFGTVDKDRIVKNANENKKLHSTDYAAKMAPQATIDLHGQTRDEAWNTLDLFVENSLKRGLKKILIIHGKGNHTGEGESVLGPLVKTYIEQHKHLGARGHPDRTMGGSGATWVLLK